MSIYEFSVRRPVTITMIFIGIILLGLRSVVVLPQELFPSVTFPQLTIVTPYANAAPEEIENLVTKIIEETISTVKNLKAVRSFSREGLSMIIAEFNWGTDMNFASLNLREKIDLIKERLPREAEEPLVLKFNPFSKPIMVYSMVSRGDPLDPSTLKMHEVLKIAKTRLKDKLEKVKGVASVAISGGQEQEIKVDLNIDQLRSNQINIMDIGPALKDSNLNYPAGTVKEDFFEYLVRTMGEFQELQDVKKCLVSIENIKRGKYDRMKRKYHERNEERPAQDKTTDFSSRFVLLEDVANVYKGFKEKTSFSRFRGKENISVTIQKQASANTIETVSLVKHELNRLMNETNAIPDGVKLTLIYDQSVFITTSIEGVVKSAMYGGILAFFVLLVFLKSFKSAFIVSATIPVSVLAAFIAMEFFELTINMMSLGGLALGIGMLVDNAIVVVENIDRYRGMGKNLTEAAIQGSAEIFGAIFSSTLTTVAVFLPLAFVIGIAGQLFKSISFTIVFSLMASLITAVTLIPRLTIVEFGGQATLDAEGGPIMKLVSSIYGKVLNRFLSFSVLGIIASIVMLGLSLVLLSQCDNEIMPKVDQGQFNIRVTLPTGSLLARTNEAAKVIENELLKNENLETLSLAVGSDKSAGASSLESLGSHQAQLMIKLKKERTETTKKVMNDLEEKIKQIKASKKIAPLNISEIVYTSEDNLFAGAFTSSAAISIEIRGRDLEKLRTLVDKVEETIATVNGVSNVRNDIPMKSPEIKIIPNRIRAAMNGVNASDLAKTAMISIKGMIGTKLKKDGQETPVLVRLRKEDRASAEAIQNLTIFANDQNIFLKEIALVERGEGPSEIKRLNQERIFRVYGDIKDRNEQEVLTEVEGILKTIKLEDNYFVGFGQEYQDKKKSQMSMVYAFLISILLVYMIMAAQFESLWQPFIIMMTVPLSVIGVSIALFITGTSLNAMSMLGLIMLGGIVVNNGIVLIEFMNDLRAEKGLPLKEAIIKAARTRLRPILMTTATTLLGLIPLALQWEEGSELQAPMAISVIGGLFISTLLTLFIIPAVYHLSESFFLRRKRRTVIV